MGVRKDFFLVGGNVNISLVVLQVANDAIQMVLHKTFYPFYTKENSQWKHALH